MIDAGQVSLKRILLPFFFVFIYLIAFNSNDSCLSYIDGI